MRIHQQNVTYFPHNLLGIAPYETLEKQVPKESTTTQEELVKQLIYDDPVSLSKYSIHEQSWCDVNFRQVKFNQIILDSKYFFRGSRLKIQAESSPRSRGFAFSK